MAEYAPLPPELNRITGAIVQAAIRVHQSLGPGLLESVYEACLAQELMAAGHSVRCQVPLPVEYNGLRLEVGFRMDMLVDDLVVVELKVSESLHPVNEAQVLTYLRFSGKRIGLLLNFNVLKMKDGIRRMVL